MSTIETATGCKITVGPKGLALWDRSAHLIGYELSTPLTADERRALADALDPERDFSGVDWKTMYEHEIRNRVAAVALLRRERDEALRKKGEAFDRAVRAERERDAAVARAEQAEKRHTWPKTTPTGHTYIAPDTYSALCHQHGNAAQAAIESWDADECPPEPTWEMVGIAHREVERIQRERDEALRKKGEAFDRAVRAERELGELRSKVNAWGRERTVPAVTHADIEKAIDGWKLTGQSRGATLADDLHALVSGSDPAVYVVRESNVEAQAALRNRFGEFVVNGTVLNVTTAEDCREKAQRHLDAVARCESIARAIEAEQAVDPVEEQARSEADRRYSGEPNHAFIEGALWANRHVLGQEADR